MAYLDMDNGSIGCWDYDMTVTFQIMEKLGMFPSIEDWIAESRQSMSKLIADSAIEHVAQDRALEQSAAILGALGILEEVRRTEIFHLTANEVLDGKTSNVGTMIYRMAMAIYHAGAADNPVLDVVNDPGSAYLRPVNSSAYESMRSEFSPMMGLPLESRMQVTKVLTAFVIASYVYHKAIEGRQK